MQRPRRGRFSWKSPPAVNVAKQYQQLTSRIQLACEQLKTSKLRRVILSSQTQPMYDCGSLLLQSLISPDVFLVDAPIEISKVSNEHNASTGLLATTRFPYSGSRFGVLVPSTRSYPMSPYIALRAMFVHVWHIEMLFKHPDVFPSVPFLYMMITSLSESSLRTLDHDIKRAGFMKVRNPTPSLTNELHDLRERLEEFESLVNMNKTYMRPNVIEFFTHFRLTYHFTMSPEETHDDLLLRSQKLSGFLMETFQLLMNMLSIMDSQKNLEQSSQSVLLGSLAAIYLPIGAATGIFGMNLKELNDSGQHVWWFVVTLIGLGLVSAVIWWLATQRLWHGGTGTGPRSGIELHRKDKVSRASGPNLGYKAFTVEHGAASRAKPDQV